MGDIQDMSDDELMALCAQDDLEAFGILFRRHQRKILNFAWRYLGDRSSAEDILQKTFLRVFLFRKSFSKKASFITWLYTIAKNLCWEESRNLNTRVQANNEGPELLDCQQPDTLERLEEEELRERVSQAISSLPSRQRAAVILSRYQGMSLAQISRVLDCSEGAVKQLLHRAILSLKKKLAAYFR